MLELLLSVGLVALVSSPTYGHTLPEFHIRPLPSVDSRFLLKVPPADQRDPDKCELYEVRYFVRDSCNVFCKVSGNFGRLRLREPHPRRSTMNRELDSQCTIPISTHGQVNVSSVEGLCGANGRCIPENENVLRTAIAATAAEIIKYKVKGTNHRVQSGHNRFGSVEFHIPRSESRNQTACEPYEKDAQTNEKPPKYQCKHVCSLNAQLGLLEFHGKPRALQGNMTDGTPCKLKSHQGENMPSEGLDVIVNGRCVGGVCRPKSWVEPSSSSTTPSSTPAAAMVAQA